MKKLILSMWLLMLSMVATAQTFVVVDKNGNRTTYDVSKLDSVTFQQSPPGFTVFDNSEQTNEEGQGEGGNEPTPTVTTYTFDEVKSFAGDPDFLFAHPDTVYVGADGQDFKFQLRTNVAYSYAPSADWLKFKADYADTDSLLFSATMNPSTTQRIGYLYFSCNNKSMLDTLVVVQSGKRDSRYIDINWDKTTLESYNKETGRAVLVFQDEVPVMGKYDVTLLPSENTYSIRLIDDVQQLSDTKVQLDTREGKMGNLFKDQQFTLCSDPSYDPSSDSGSSSEGGTKPTKAPAISGNIIYPESIELCENGRPVMEVYNRRSQLEKEYNIFEYKYDNSGSVIWEKGANKVSWNTCTFDVGLKGIFSFDFGNVAWEDVRFGDLQNFKAYLDGDFNTELILQYELTKGVEAKYEKTLKKDIFSYRVKFMVGTIPVWINLKSDLKASVEAKAEGTVAVTGGVRASANLKGGVEWDTNRGVNPISSFDYQYELVSPEVTAEAHAEAKAYVWPEINIGIYDVLCPTINPKPYIRAYADARTAEANKPFFGWNAGVSTGVDLTLGLNLDLYFWKKEIGEIDPINLIDRDLVAVPTKIELEGDTISRVLKGTTHEVKYKVKGHNSITGSDYLIPGALVKIESLGGGEIDKESGYYYSNLEGEVIVKFEQTDTIPAYLKATLFTGDEERDRIAKNWHTEIVDFRFSAVADESGISATRNGKAEAIFLLEEYRKNKADENGEWSGAYGYTVQCVPTGGTVKSDEVITNDKGYAIIEFDGGEGFSGGSLTATAIVNEFELTFTEKLSIHKFSFDDPHLAKAYNLPDNTVSFDDGYLPVVYKGGEYEHYEYDPESDMTAGTNSFGPEPPSDRFKIKWVAEKVYSDNILYNDVWNRKRKFVQGASERYHDAETILECDGVNFEWDYKGYLKSNYDCFSDNIDIKSAQVEYKLNNNAWESYAEKWRQEQIRIALENNPDADVSELREALKDQYPTKPHAPEKFDQWTTNALAPSMYDENDPKAFVTSFSTSDLKCKQIMLNEGNSFVFLSYIVEPNGDALYVKVKFNEKDFDEFTKYTYSRWMNMNGEVYP